VILVIYLSLVEVVGRELESISFKSIEITKVKNFRFITSKKIPKKNNINLFWDLHTYVAGMQSYTTPRNLRRHNQQLKLKQMDRIQQLK